MLFSGDSRTGFVIIYLPLEVAPLQSSAMKNIDRMRGRLKIKNRSERLDLQERRRIVRQTSCIKIYRCTPISDGTDAKPTSLHRCRCRSQKVAQQEGTMMAAGSLWNSRPGLVDTEYLELFFLDSFNVSFELFSVFFLLLFLYLLYQGCGWVFVFIIFFSLCFWLLLTEGSILFFLSLYSAQGKCWIRSHRARAIHDWSRLYLEVASVTITAMLLVMINVWCLDKVKV